MNNNTPRLLATLIAGLLFSAAGGLYLQAGADSTQVVTDDPTSLLAAADAPTIRSDQQFRQVPVPTTVAPNRGFVSVSDGRPAAPPRTPRAAVPIVQIGTIEIPKVGLVHPVYEGIHLTVIDRGPGHWPGTALPGQRGNAVFAGHRVTHSKPFRNIDQLGAGDQVIFNISGTRSVYEFVRSEVVTPKELRIVDQTAEPTATIFACHPPGSARYRYVEHLKLVQG